MLAGVKFIPRDKLNREQDESSKSVGRKKKHSKKEKISLFLDKEKEKSSRYSSSDEEELGRIKEGSGKKKWYSSEEFSSSGSSEARSEEDTRKHLDHNKGKEERDSGHKSRRSMKRKSRSSEKYQSYHSTSSSDSEDLARDKRSHQKERHHRTVGDDTRDERNDSWDDFGQQEIVRREMGLEWMLRPESRTQKPQINDDNIQDESSKNEDHEMKVNPKELNPYLKNNGSGYPEDEEQLKSGGDQLLSSSFVGDGGASWRLKALKRAQEQASREGRNLEEVVTERWGSLGQLAVNSASRAAAPSRAHLSAIKQRKKGLAGEEGVEQNSGDNDNQKSYSRSYLRGTSSRNPEMRVPKVGESLSWKRHRGQSLSSRDAASISAAVSGLNKFANDGSFMQEARRQQRNDSEASDGSQSVLREKDRSEEHETRESMPQVKTGLSANQLAAKALQLRMQGKNDQAEKLMQEVESIKSRPPVGDSSERETKAGSSSRIVTHEVSFHKKKHDDDSDMHLARNIMQNKQYSLSGCADDEYDFEGCPRKKSRKKGHENDHKVHTSVIAKRILTQQERCLFCFENPSRPKHLVVSIANLTYLMLPQRQPVVPGHCCIVPMQHESSTRTIDNNVWDEIRNFKKCLIMMFAKQEKDLIFLETVMGLAQQRRHCLIECLPLPREIAKEAPLYFKKAIDEAEDEWSQHNAKKLIDTSVKGLRASIPKDFPYFHVEFGLNKGFVHVIDDEKQFNNNLGLNVIRGMMQLPEEDMYRRRRYESIEVQKQAVASFARDWAPYDWTKQLD